MGKVRTALAAATISAGLLAGIAAPAAPAAASDQRLFGVYYELWACQMYGNSLTQAGAWTYYNCVYDYYPSDGQYHWYLYVWS